MKYISADKGDIETIYNFSKKLIDNYEDLKTINYDYVLKWLYQKIEKHIKEYRKVYLDNLHVGYYRFIKDGDKMELDDLYIFEEYQNQGIGTKIIQECIKDSELPIF